MPCLRQLCQLRWRNSSGGLGPDNQLFGHISVSTAVSTQLDLESRSDTWNKGEACLTSQGCVAFLFKYHSSAVRCLPPCPHQWGTASLRCNTNKEERKCLGLEILSGGANLEPVIPIIRNLQWLKAGVMSSPYWSLLSTRIPCSCFHLYMPQDLVHCT